MALCSFTFVLGALLLGALLLIVEPEVLDRFVDVLPISTSRTTGAMILALVGLYVFGSWLGLKPLRLGGLQIHYPRLPIVARQLIIGPIELMAAAAIIYFALPAAGNPGYFVVLGVFVISFSVALLSHAPGGLGVLEVVFLAGLSDMDPAAVLAALLVFRLLLSDHPADPGAGGGPGVREDAILPPHLTAAGKKSRRRAHRGFGRDQT